MMERGKQSTIYDISEKAGVSIATVSRVLNGSNKVSQVTKEKVLKVMEECGYEPNVYARGLGSGSSKTIGILCADVTDIYLAKAISYLESDLKSHGFNTILNCTGYDYEKKVEAMRNMESRRVDAIILVGSHYTENTDEKNKYIVEVSGRIPVMLVNGYIRGNNIYCNLSDDYEAYYNVTERLIQSGCRDILFLYIEDSYCMKNKFRGYADALNKYGMREQILQSEGRICNTKEDLLVYSQQGNLFDAVITTCDELAIGAVKFAQKAGIKIPEELSVVGCDNSVMAICSSPELSSIDNKCELLCANTVTYLMRVLDGENASSKTVISADYIERETTRRSSGE